MADLTNGGVAATAPTPNADTTIADAEANTHKRKRDDETVTAEDAPRILRIQKDILEVLAGYDTEPSFLDHEITPNEPSQKKARLSDPAGNQSSIAAKLKDARYASLGDLRKDASAVSDELVTAIRTKARDRASFTGGRPTVEELKLINKIQALDALVQDIVDREARYDEAARRELQKEESGHANGQGSNSTACAASIARAGTVLTLFGNAPGPKQLFSSLQHAADQKDPLIKAELPIEEMNLPNGISATKIAFTTIDEPNQGPTFQQAFAPPYSLATLQPPKVYKRPVPRDQSVTWEFKDPIQRNKRGGYTVQPLTTATWLGYGGVDAPEAASTREKRKRRDRALSFGDGTARNEKSDTSEEALKWQEEALFRRAYSSFAPPKDNSNAIVSEEVKNMVWWQKIGERRYHETFAIDPALLDDAEKLEVPELTRVDEWKEDEFGQVLDDLDELEKTEVELPSQPAKDKTDVEQVLREVSELLETLASHQRVRNASLPSSNTVSRTPISPGPAVALQTGKPDEPSEQETATYYNLRRELAYLLLKLPPYAIAKLDGDQLAELDVKTLVPYELKDVKGLMEEDLVTRQTKLAAMATANSIANLARPNSSTSAQRYNQTPQGTPAIGAAAHTRYGASYNGRPPPATTPSFQRQASNPGSYGVASAARPSYGVQSQQYNRPAAAQVGYGQTNGQQYYGQRPVQQTPGGFNYNQQYQQTPLQNQQYGRGPTAASYQNNSISQQQAYNRNSSPAKSSFSMQQANPPRPMYPAAPQQLPQQQQQQPGSGRATPVSYPSNPHTPVGNGYPPPVRPVQGLAPRPLSTTPQPPHHTGPTQPPPQHVVANGNS